MKKFKMMFATLMLGMAIVGGYQAYEYVSMTATGSVLLENAEALASGGETEARISCQNTLVNEGSGTISKVKCSNCLDVKCTDYSDSGKCRK